MKKRNFSILSLLSILITGHAQAFTTFSSGTTISASAMNANFAEVSNNYLLKPVSAGSPGNVLTLGAGGAITWAAPAGATLPVGSNGNFLMHNGSGWVSVGLSFSATNSAGPFAWSGSGSTWTLNIPPSNSTTNGLLSSADWSSFNTKIGNGGNSFAGLLTLGTNDNNDFAFETNNTERMRITNTGNINMTGPVAITGNAGISGNLATNGNVAIGTSSTLSKLEVVETATNYGTTPHVRMVNDLDGSSVHQIGVNIETKIYQTGTAGYSALQVNANHVSGTASGKKNLLELSTTSGGVTKSQFEVNDKGFISTDGFMFKISNTLSATSCTNVLTTSSGTSLGAPAITFDFGSSNQIVLTSETVVETIVELPAFSLVSGTLTKPYAFLASSTTTKMLLPGRNVLRLAAGTYSMKVGCETSSSAMIDYSSGGGVLGVRRFH